MNDELHDKLVDDMRWDREPEQTNLDGDYDTWLNCFVNLSDDDIERLARRYDAGELCSWEKRAWEKWNIHDD